MHLVIIGHRGSGKTTVGHDVAVRLGSAFVDLDDATLSRFGTASIVEVWRTHGERAWRDAEASALADLQLGRPPDGQSPPLVVALGGGTPTVEHARRLLEELRTARAIFIAWLRTPVETIVARLEANPGDRPLLTTALHEDGDPLAHHAALLADRDPIYAALADATIDGTAPVAVATQAVIDAWLAAHAERR